MAVGGQQVKVGVGICLIYSIIMRHLGYYLAALGIAAFIFFGIVWGPALGLWLTLVFTAPSLSAALGASVKLFGLALSDSDPILTFFYLATALLVGANVALLVFYFKKYRAVPASGTATGALAALITVLGFGCASCGTLFLTLLATSLGGVGLVAVPIEGGIIWVMRGIGLALLTFSLYQLIRRARDPLICSIE